MYLNLLFFDAKPSVSSRILEPLSSATAPSAMTLHAHVARAQAQAHQKQTTDKQFLAANDNSALRIRDPTNLARVPDLPVQTRANSLQRIIKCLQDNQPSKRT